MKDNIILSIAVVSLILSITAITLEASYRFSNSNLNEIEGTVWTSSNDGAGSGLGADTLDGFDNNQFLRNDGSGNIEGDLHVNGNITFNTKYRYYTIPATSFLPVSDDTDYSQFGSILYPRMLSPNANIHYAPIQLPDGAIITKLIIHYTKIDHSANFTLKLSKWNHPSGLLQIKTIELPEKMNFTDEPYESENLSVLIDNYNEAYFIDLIIEIDHLSDVIFYWVTIEYIVDAI